MKTYKLERDIIAILESLSFERAPQDKRLRRFFLLPRLKMALNRLVKIAPNSWNYI